MGFKILIAPVRKLNKLANDAMVMQDYESLLITSVNAVDSVKAGMKVICVGEKTAQAARINGGKVDHCFERIENLIDWLSSQNSAQLVYAHGDPISIDLSTIAGLKHHKIRMVKVYEMSTIMWKKHTIFEVESLREAIFPVFSTKSALSLRDNLSALSSQFRARIFPISNGVASIFEEKQNLLIESPPEVPNWSLLKQKIENAFKN